MLRAVPKTVMLSASASTLQHLDVPSKTVKRALVWHPAGIIAPRWHTFFAVQRTASKLAGLTWHFTTVETHVHVLVLRLELAKP